MSIGAISGSAARLLIAAVAELQRLRPLLVVKMLEQSSDQLIVWLAERKIDVMIGRFIDESQRDQFQYERLAGEGLQVSAGVHHPRRGSDAPGLTELSHWPWILYPTSTALRKVSDHIFSSIGLSLTSGIVETPSFLFALELMQSTNMLSLQPAAHRGRTPRPHARLWPDHAARRATQHGRAGLHGRDPKHGVPRHRNSVGRIAMPDARS